MKILVLDIDGNTPVTVGADSAILRHGEPLFLAEERHGWLSAVMPALRIGRLGLRIPRKAASEYIDACGLFHVLIPPLMTGAWAAADRTFAPGTWLDTSPWPESFETEAGTYPFITADEAADAVSRLSGHMTFKTGDIILFGNKGVARALPPPRTNIRASVSGQPVLDLKLR